MKLSKYMYKCRSFLLIFALDLGLLSIMNASAIRNMF